MTHLSRPRTLAALLTASTVAGVALWVRPAATDTPAAVPAPPLPPVREWPMFGGDGSRNQVNRIERNLPDSWDVGEPMRNIKWAVQLGSKTYGGPVVAGGKIFCGTNNDNPRNPRDRRPSRQPGVPGEAKDKGVMMCFEEATGRFLWQAVHDKLASGTVHDWPRMGIPSMPAVEGNRLYYVSNRCELVCADTEGFLDGKNDGVQDEQYRDRTDADIVWRLDMMKELGVFPHNLSICAPLLVGELVFVVTANGVDEGHIKVPAPQAPSFVAVNKRTGRVVWADNSPGKNVMHGQWSNPSYAVTDGVEQVIFPGGDGWLRGFDPPTGKLLWKFDCNPKGYPKYELGGKGLRSDFIATPVVYQDRVYIGVGQDPEHYEGVGHLWCIDLRRALARGAAHPERDVSPVGDNFDPADRENRARSALEWHYGGLDRTPHAKRDYVFGRTLSTCAVHDGLVYVGEISGYLHCLDAHTGQRYWIEDLKATTVWGSAFWADNKVYLPTEDGDVWIFAHGKEKRLIRRIEMEKPIRGQPVAVNGTLYLQTESVLYAIRQR
jgi:outer membrane protein assembly factor BamB